MGVIHAEVIAALDERSSHQVADRLVRDVGTAGQRAGQQFSTAFTSEMSTRLNENALASSVRRLETQFARSGKVSAEAFGNAIAAEASRTGLAADKIGAELTKHLEVHGQTAGNVFAQAFTSKLSSIAPMASTALSGISAMARGMGAEVGAGGAVAAGGVLAIVAAGAEVVHKLYEVGQTFDTVSRTAEIRTGKMGSDLEALTESIDHVAIKTASSLEQIGDIAGKVTQAFHVSGEPLENLTKQIADLDRMTGEKLNVRDLGKVMRAFGLDASAAGGALDELKVASENTGAPVGELLATMKAIGPQARSLHLDFGQTAAVIDMFDQAGLDATTTTRGLNKAIAEAVKNHLDLKTVLGQGIEEIRKFLEAGNEQKAQELAQKLFGAKGAQMFIDAIRNGKLTVEELNDALKSTSSAGHIEALNDATMRWADTWTIVQNRIEDALKPLGEPVFDLIQNMLRDLADPGRGSTFTSPIPQTPTVTLGPGNLAPALGLPGLPGMGPTPTPGGMPVAPPLNVNPNDPMYKILMGQGTGPLIPGPAAPTGPAAGPGSQDMLGALSTDTTGKPSLPFPAEYGQPAAPGETPEHWRDRMGVIEAQHDLAEKRALVDKLEKAGVDKQDEIIKARNEVIQAEMHQTEAEQRLNQQKLQALQVPYGPGYGAAPRPGETSAQYSAEQSFYEAQHKSAQARGELQQLERSGTATTAQLAEAHNNLIKAQTDEYQSQLRLQEAFTKTGGKLDEIGAKLDPDFGISKGLAGIAENVVKFVANLAAAPLLGALGAVSAAAGGKDATGSGLIGMIAGSMGYGGAGGPAGLAGMAGRLPAALAGGGGGYPGDAALLAGVPAGRYEQTTAAADLTRGIADCSSAVEDLVNIMDGRPTSGREMSTGNANEWLAQHGFQSGMGSPGDFRVGFNSEHMQATLPGGTPFNWGSNAAAAQRGIGGTGADDSAFTSHFFRPTGSSTSGGGLNWNALAQAEASGNWANTSNPKYKGGLQFDQQTWNAYKPPGAPSNPAAATQEQQIAAGQAAIQARGGPQSLWPQNWQQLGPGADPEAAIRAGFVPQHPGIPTPPTPLPAYAEGGGVSQPGFDPHDYGTNILNPEIQHKTGMWWPGPPDMILKPGFGGGRGAFGGVPQPGDRDPRLPDWWFGQGAVPIIAHEGEHVLTKGDVAAAGGQAAVYAWRRALHYDDGGSIGSILNTLTAPPGGQPPPKTSEQLILPGITPPGQQTPRTTEQLLLPGGSTPPGPAAAPPGAGVQGPSRVGGSEAPHDSSGASAGGGSGGLPGAAVSAAASMFPGAGAAAQIGMQEMTRAIKAVGQYTGSAAEGLMTTFLPFGGSELAQNNWLTRIAGAAAQAAPALPNMAGKPASGPLTEQQAFGAPPSPFGATAAPQSVPQAPQIHIGEIHVDKPETADKIIGDHTMASYAAGITGQR